MSQSPARQTKAAAASREASSRDTKASWDATGSEPAANSIATGNYASATSGGKLKLHAVDCTDCNVGHNALLTYGKLIGVPWDAASRGWHNAAARFIPAIAVAGSG